MGLLQPESGLLFWMTLAFVVVFAVLAKFGFPVILRAIDERKAYIDTSLGSAREAERRLAEIETECRKLVAEAEAQRGEMLRAVAATREELLAEARRKAEAEGARLLAEARAAAETERQELLRDARRQVALLAVAVTEKMLRRKLTDEAAQSALAERMLDELKQSNDHVYRIDS